MVSDDRWPTLSTPYGVPGVDDTQGDSEHYVGVPPCGTPAVITDGPDILLAAPASPTSGPAPQVGGIIIELVTGTSPDLCDAVEDGVDRTLLQPGGSHENTAATYSDIFNAKVISINSNTDGITVVRKVGDTTVGRCVPYRPDRLSTDRETGPPRADVPGQWPDALVTTPTPHSSTKDASIFRTSGAVS